MAAKKETAKVAAEIKNLNVQRIKVKVVGDTPLIMHKWSEKAKKEILDKQMGVTKTKARELKNPVRDFVTSMYWITPEPKLSDDATPEEWMDAFNEAIEKGARFGFPATAFKQSANASAYRLGWFDNQMGLRSSWFIEPSQGDLVEVFTDQPPVMREDMVKVGMGTADIRYRGELRNWYAYLNIQVLANGPISVEQIVNNINAGGFCCGVGEWRTEKDGISGKYHVEAV